MSIAVGQDEPQRVVQAFIDLVQRHEQAFYSFVHKVHSKGEGLFDSLMKWIQLYLTLVREGLGEKISLEYLLPHAGQDRVDVLKEVDEVALYHYKLKLAHEDKLRRRFGKTQGQSDADAEDEATQMLINGVVHDLSFGELLRGDVDEIAAAESEEDESSEEEEDSSEYETASESGSEEESSGDGASRLQSPPPPPPKPISRSSTISHPPQSPIVHHHSNRHTSVQNSVHRARTAHSHQERGRVDTQNDSRTLRPRSRSRSISALKAVFSKSSVDAPPVPPLPGQFPSSPLSKPLPPSPLSGRSSQDSQAKSQRRRLPTPRPHRKRKDKNAFGLKQPDLKHIPNLLPVFVEIVSVYSLEANFRSFTLYQRR